MAAALTAVMFGLLLSVGVAACTPPADTGPQPPVAVANALPLSGPAPLDVSFTSAGSYSQNSSGSLTARDWTFGDGSTGSGAAVFHTYAAPGTYVVTLTVTNELGVTASATVTVVVT